MTSAAANYHESSSFIHLRYEDTALTIFNQQQKLRQDEKRREKQLNSTPHSQHSKHQGRSVNQEADFTRFGNRGVLAKEPDKPPILDETKVFKHTEPSVKHTEQNDKLEHRSAKSPVKSVNQSAPNSRDMPHLPSSAQPVKSSVSERSPRRQPFPQTQ